MQASHWYRFIQAQMKQKKLSHAYLLVGTQAFSVAEKMAQTILCDEERACGSCPSCHRVLANSHANLKLLRSEEGRLKKEEVLDLKTSFSQTSLEKNKKQIYIIEDIEEASLSALNSLLKFLEEPEGDVLAILTSEYQNRILDTIQSRCLILHVDQEVDKKTWLDESMQEYPKDYLHIMLSIANEKAVFKDLVANKRYLDFYEAMEKYYHLHSRKDLLLFYHYMTQTMKPNLEELNILLEMMKEKTDDKKVLKNILKTQDRLRPGFNPNLLIDQLMGAIL